MDIAVGEYFTDVVHWPLHWIHMSFLGTFHNDGGADHVGCSGDVEQ